MKGSAVAGRRILIVEDDPPLRMVLEQVIQKKGIETVLRADGPSALDALANESFDLVLTDLMMKPMDGLALLEAARRAGFEGPFIIITACNDLQTAVEAMRRGVFDYIVKPLRIADVMETLDRAFQYLARRQGAGITDATAEQLVAISPPMRRAVELGRRLAMTHAPLLISGEPGTGKTLFARMIHESSPRRERRFHMLDCRRVLPEEILRAIGNGKSPIGASVAPGGTLFLHHISALPLTAQALLRERLHDGATLKDHSHDSYGARLVASTAVSLASRVESGEFDSELYRCIHALTIALPPFRERSEDLAPLALGLLSALSGGQDVEIEPTVLAAIERYAWPGNGYEMERVLREALTAAGGGRITCQALPSAIREILCSGGDHTRSAEGLRGQAFKAMLKAREYQTITLLLRKWNGDRRKVAEILGISLRDLEQKLNQGPPTALQEGQRG